MSTPYAETLGFAANVPHNFLHLDGEGVAYAACNPFPGGGPDNAGTYDAAKRECIEANPAVARALGESVRPTESLEERRYITRGAVLAGLLLRAGGYQAGDMTAQMADARAVRQSPYDLALADLYNARRESWQGHDVELSYHARMAVVLGRAGIGGLLDLAVGGYDGTFHDETPLRDAQYGAAIAVLGAAQNQRQ